MQGLYIHEFHFCGVEPVKAKVVNGIAIDRVDIHLFVIQKNGFRNHRARHHYVAIGEQNASLCIDDETGCRHVARGVPVEGARGIDSHHDDRGGNPVEDVLPSVGRRRDRSSAERQSKECVQHLKLFDLRGDSRQIA